MVGLWRNGAGCCCCCFLCRLRQRVSSHLDGIIKIHTNRAKGGNEWRHDCGIERNFKGTALGFCGEMDAVRVSHKRLSSQAVGGACCCCCGCSSMPWHLAGTGFDDLLWSARYVRRVGWLTFFTITLYKRVYFVIAREFVDIVFCVGRTDELGAEGGSI